MDQNLISAEISPADALAVEQLLAQAKEKLPFLLTLSPEQRQNLTKAGDAYKSFLDKAVQVVNQYPQILSNLFDKEEFLRDYALAVAIAPLVSSASSLAQALEDTHLALRSDSMMAALEVYNSVQTSVTKVPGLRSILDEMQVFFAKKRQTIKPEVKQ